MSLQASPKVQSVPLKLNSRNTIVIREEISQDSVQRAELALNAAVIDRGDEKWPIYLVLDSPGGDIDAGDSFIQFAKNIPNVKTVSIFSASMAAVIAESLPGERLMPQNGVLMFHRAAGGLSGQFDGEFESRLGYVKAIIKRINEAVAARMKLTLPEYNAKIVNELWLPTEQAIAQHAADKAVDMECSQELIDKKQQSKVCIMFGCSNVTYSACPLLRAPVSVEMSDL